MTRIAICVCTRKRNEGLKNLLYSLFRLIVPADMVINIIVVENDSANFSEHIVKEFAFHRDIRIGYFLEKRQGISNARNKSVEKASGSDFCCFVDDDQIVAPDWLSELIRCQQEFNADGVWGSNPPIFEKDVPSWIRQFYEPERFAYGTIVNKAFTNCLLIRKSYLDRLSGPFDTTLNYSGGEDSYLTSLLTKMGAVIRYNPQAIAYEVIPESRTKLRFILKRTFRISNTELLIKSLLDREFSYLKAMKRLILRFSYGLLISIPYLIFGTKEKLKGLIKIANATGGLVFIAGRHNRFYK